MTTLSALLDTLGIAPTATTPFVRYDTGQSLLIPIGGALALTAWYQLRLAAPTTNLWPVLLGDAAALAAHEYRLSATQNVSSSDDIAVTSVITSSLSIDPPIWFRSQAHRHDQIYHTTRAAEEPEITITKSFEASSTIEPTWRLQSDPYITEPNTFAIPTEISYPEPNDAEIHIHIHPAPVVYLLLLPTQIAWHVPAYLAYDAWNDAPSIEGHLLAWRWWGQLHHAEIVGIANNMIEAWVAVPPSDNHTGKRLAWEHQLYCPDISNDDRGIQIKDSLVWRFAWH